MAYDWKYGASGATSGAITGAKLGSIIPGVGTGIGATVGGVAGGLTGFFGGEKNKKKPNQLSTFDPQQKQLYDQQVQALKGGGGPLADVYGQFNADQMRDYYQQAFAQPAYQEFQENIVPTITGQFRGQNLQNSSYLGGALSKAGTNVQNNLNGQIAQLLYKGQQSSLDRRSNALNNILGLDTHINENQPSVFDDLLNGLASSSKDIVKDYISSRSNKTPDETTQTSHWTFGKPMSVGG